MFKLLTSVYIAMTLISATAECVPVSRVKADAISYFAGSHIAEMGGTEAKSFLTALHIPEGDYVLVVMPADKVAVVVVVFHKGCATVTRTMTRPAFEGLMRVL